jgi:hypothetical protein
MKENGGIARSNQSAIIKRCRRNSMVAPQLPKLRTKDLIVNSVHLGATSSRCLTAKARNSKSAHGKANVA